MPRLAVLAVTLLFAGAAHADLSAPPPLPAAAAPQPPSAAPADPKDAGPTDLPPAQKAAPDTRIEQRRQGNRIVEITVTPAGTQRSYTIVNREGQRPLSVQELSAGLSTPRFFKLDF